MTRWLVALAVAMLTAPPAWWRPRRCPAVFVWPAVDPGPWAGPADHRLPCGRPVHRRGMHHATWTAGDGTYSVTWRD